MAKLFHSQLSSVPIRDFHGNRLTEAQRVTRYNNLRAFQMVLEDELSFEWHQFLQAEKTRRSKTELLTYFEQKAAHAQCEELISKEDSEDLDFIKILRENCHSKDNIKKIVKLMKKIWRSDKENEEARKETLSYNFVT